MSGTNHLVLLENVISSQKEEYGSLEKKEDFFNFFVAKEILKYEDLSIDEIESGITDGTRDGGIDAIYFFVNDILIQEEVQLNINFQKNPIFNVHIIQASTETGFKESRIITIINTLDELFDLTKDDIYFQQIYNEKICEKINLF